MTEVVRFGGVARVDPRTPAQLTAWQEVDDPVEVSRRLEDHARGEIVVVRLDLFAEVIEGERISRCYSVGVGGLWFSRSDEEGNTRHAEEIARTALDDLARGLGEQGVSLDVEDLSAAPFRLELNEELRAQLAVSTNT